MTGLPHLPAPRPAALVVPVKAFGAAKARLAPVLDPEARAELARAMASTVLRAGGRLLPHVVCDDEAVRAWAEQEGAEVVWTPDLGLNGAIEAALAHLARRGVVRAVVAHADLPLAADLEWLADFDGVTLVPDRHRDGTNVLALPTGLGFRFAYGAGSFRAHWAEAARHGATVRIVADPALAWDVDVPADLEGPGHPAFPPAVASLAARARPTAEV
mgnify:CR=1 FL=1